MYSRLDSTKGWLIVVVDSDANTTDTAPEAVMVVVYAGLVDDATPTDSSRAESKTTVTSVELTVVVSVSV